MPLSLLNTLFPGNFRGIPFLVVDTSTSSGRKIVVHEFPNSDRRYLEDLGKLSKKFSMTVIVAGESYLFQKDLLIEALEQEGPGILVHPYFGVVNVVALPYTLTENTKELGVATFSLNFQISDQAIFPTEVAKYLSQIQNLAGVALSFANDDFSNLFGIKSVNRNNYKDADLTLRGYVVQTQEIRDTFTSEGEPSSNFDIKFEKFQEDFPHLIRSSEDLGSAILDLFNEINNSAINENQKFVLFQKYFFYKTEEAKFDLQTPARIERYNNRDSIDSLINITTLIYAYNTVPFQKYFDVLDIEETFKILEEQYRFIIQNANFSLDSNTLETLKELRNKVRSFLSEEKMNVYDLINIETTQIPMKILAYRYYANIDNTDQLLTLNNISTPANVSGDITIFNTFNEL